MMTIATPLRAFDVPAYLLAATGTPFQGRTAPTAGLRNPAGVLVDATTFPCGTSMI